ncbi:hypothetical protein J3458_003036 [Metarhizium acridum]|uniref:uncharacterized protein n=1 Tax=Metarhizium acridum TaxID=92637 RepID=UPI001C6AE652|nr:hypothetical protein J3458_003036 [Metarhizium acridum]
MVCHVHSKMGIFWYNPVATLWCGGVDSLGGYFDTKPQNFSAPTSLLILHFNLPSFPAEGQTCYMDLGWGLCYGICVSTLDKQCAAGEALDTTVMDSWHA